jgi:hypothetical protein
MLYLPVSFCLGWGFGHSGWLFFAVISSGLAAIFLQRLSRLFADLLVSGITAFVITLATAALSSSPLGTCGCCSRFSPVSRSGQTGHPHAA